MSMIDSPLTDALERFLDVDVARAQLVTANLANIDTPGYRTRDLNFHAELERATAQAQQSNARGATLQYGSYTPAVHTVRGLMERPDGNNVSLERETLLLADTQMKFNLGVALLKDQFHLVAEAISSGGSSS